MRGAAELSVPASLMPAAQPVRIILHWTAGGPVPSATDLERYHLLVDRRGKVHGGDHSIAANDLCDDDDYAAHTRRCNTRAIGVALCGMAGANENPFAPGKWPIQREQWNAMLFVAAALCRRYRIPPEPRCLLTHCEVPEFLGVPQPGKWDVSVRCWESDYDRMTPGEELRLRVGRLLAGG